MSNYYSFHVTIFYPSACSFAVEEVLLSSPASEQSGVELGYVPFNTQMQQHGYFWNCTMNQVM